MILLCTTVKQRAREKWLFHLVGVLVWLALLSTLMIGAGLISRVALSPVLAAGLSGQMTPNDYLSTKVPPPFTGMTRCDGGIDRSSRSPLGPPTQEGAVCDSGGPTLISADPTGRQSGTSLTRCSFQGVAIRARRSISWTRTGREAADALRSIRFDG
jgi:hypothetical protein